MSFMRPQSRVSSLCYTRGLWQAPPHGIIVTTMPLRGGLCPDLHPNRIGKDARRGTGGLFIVFVRNGSAMHLDFQKSDGLITAVVQDHATGRVLMVGYMNEEAFRKTVETGYTT